MRNVVLLVLALCVPLMTMGGAPIPAPVISDAKQKQLDDLWKNLLTDDANTSKAVLKFYKRGDEAVAYFRTKLRPLTLTEKRCRQLIKDLVSDDEVVAKAARDEFDYFDPRLAIDLVTLMDEYKTNPERVRLVETVGGSPIGSRKNDTIEFRSIGNKPDGSVEGYNFASNRSSWWAEHHVKNIGIRHDNKSQWRRAVHALVILDEIGSPLATKLIEEMTTGHPEALPTVTAKKILESRKPKAEPAPAEKK